MHAGKKSPNLTGLCSVSRRRCVRNPPKGVCFLVKSIRRASSERPQNIPLPLCHQKALTALGVFAIHRLDAISFADNSAHCGKSRASRTLSAKRPCEIEATCFAPPPQMDRASLQFTKEVLMHLIASQLTNMGCRTFIVKDRMPSTSGAGCLDTPGLKWCRMTVAVPC